MHRKIFLLLSFFTMFSVLSACSNTEVDNKATFTDSVIIDVRTPEEFALGHLKGAVNIDFNASDFDQSIKSLDPKDKYLIYCRSGNRSSQALKRMQEYGFNNIIDLGSVESASLSTGIDIIS